MRRAEIVIVPLGTWFAYLILRYVLIGVLIEIFSYEIIVVFLIILFGLLFLGALFLFLYIVDNYDISENKAWVGGIIIALLVIGLFFYAKNQIRNNYDEHKKGNAAKVWNSQPLPFALTSLA